MIVAESEPRFRSPSGRQPATDRTEVRILHDRGHLSSLVTMPWGNFLMNLSTLRVDYTFSPRRTVRSLSQYNSATHDTSNNVRFNPIYKPGSDIYIVYINLSQTGLPADIFGRTDRQIIMKATDLLQR